MTSGKADHSGNTAFWRELVYRGVESDELDYKAAMNWNLLSKSGRAKLVRLCCLRGPWGDSSWFMGRPK